jgi:hypothetical protein
MIQWLSWGSTTGKFSLQEKSNGTIGSAKIQTTQIVWVQLSCFLTRAALPTKMQGRAIHFLDVVGDISRPKVDRSWFRGGRAWARSPINSWGKTQKYEKWNKLIVSERRNDKEWLSITRHSKINDCARSDYRSCSQMWSELRPTEVQSAGRLMMIRGESKWKRPPGRRRKETWQVSTQAPWDDSGRQ